MAKEFSREFYKSNAWQNCRLNYIKSVGGLCEDCLAKGIYKPGAIVHHITNLSPDNIHDPTVTLSWDNLRYVCRDCHAAEHRHVRERRYIIGPDGHVLVTGT